MAATAAQKGGRYLASDQEHRRAASVRGANGSAGIEDAGPRHDGEHARSPGRARVAERHVTAGLLVPRAYGADAVAPLLERVEQRIELGAGQAEHRIDPVGDQRLNDRHAAGHGAGLGPVSHVISLHTNASCHIGARANYPADRGAWVGRPIASLPIKVRGRARETARADQLTAEIVDKLERA